MSFVNHLKTGQITEGLIARWLMARQSIVMPAYQIEQHTGKGPQLFSLDKQLVAPDMLVFNHNGMVWVEAKHKSVFTWHRVTMRWTTGIDMRHYVDYLHVAKTTRLPVYLLFFHANSAPSEIDRKFNCPEECPTGLFGGELFDLVTKENHRSPHFDRNRTGMVGHGNSGMVYWAADDLKLFATKDQIIEATQRKAA